MHSFGEEIDLNSYTSNAFTCPCDGYICVSTTTTSQEKQAFAYVNGKILCVARPNGIYGGYADLYVKKGMYIVKGNTDTDIKFIPLLY